ncbi:MAG: 30S ribosomal protein S16 [Candidatus Eiseniibacteriota bacterium]
MSVVIRLMRAGAKKRPFFRMVAADSRRQRDGRFLEILGHYNPLTQPYELVVHKDRVESWITKGAQPSEQAASLLRSLGISLRPAPIARPVPADAGLLAPPAPKPAKKAKPKVVAKPAVKRTKARKVSARKVEKKVARKTAKKAAKKA